MRNIPVFILTIDAYHVGIIANDAYYFQTGQTLWKTAKAKKRQSITVPHLPDEISILNG